MLLRDNAPAHTSMPARTRALLGHLNWELFDHPPYSPDLAPNDYHFFTCLRDKLVSQLFKNIEELMEGVQTCLSSQAADFFDTSVLRRIS
jgi:hypothetical protein